MKSFNNWKTQEVEEIFHIKEKVKHPLLKKWLKAECEISELERISLGKLSDRLSRNVHLWNEMELRGKFLIPLMELVDYDTENYQTFMERSLTVVKGTDETTGTVDFLIAKGRQIPRSPFFSVHEYKPEPSGRKDPLGQLLIALIAMHQANQKQEHSFPLYGAYVIGPIFYFVVFDGKFYSKSKPYVAADKEILEIFQILKEVKIYIEEVISPEPIP